MNVCDIGVATTANDDTIDKLFIAENVESLWGPIPLSRLPVGQDNTCRAVTHG